MPDRSLLPRSALDSASVRVPCCRLLLIVALFALSADAGVAFAQTQSGAPEPQAVEPQAGEAAPAQPGATTPTVEAVPDPVVSDTAGGVAAGPATAGGLPATAGGTPGASADDDSGSGGLSWADAVALTIAALLIAVAIVLVLWQLRGWDPRWLRRWRHATAEAGWRVSLGWAEFRDFVRLGR
jgi:hypothetical protein